VPDVGDFRTPTLTVSPYDGTTTASVTVTAPDGTTQTIAATGAAGVWTASASYEFTMAGVWVETWTVTGAGAGSESSYVVVLGEAQPAQLGTAFATVGDLEARLGRALTADEAARAPAMLADASDAIREFCRRDWTPTSNAVIILRPVANYLRLPNRPVSSVDSVEMIGVGGTANLLLPLTAWAFDKIDRITLHTSSPTVLTGTVPGGSYEDVYRVVYDYGGTIPTGIRRRTVTMVLRTLLAPTKAEGLVSERIGQYMYTYGQFPGGQSPGPTVQLTREDERALRQAGYRSAAGTIQLRL